jgi:hypothetical protein
MRINFLILLIAFLLITVSSAAQDEMEAAPVCSQPFSTKFDEFPFTNLNDAQERIDLFGLQIKNQNARGIVIGYGGKRTESGQGRKIASDIGQYLTTKFKFTEYYTITDWDGGHRDAPEVELFIKPESCSSYPESSPTLTFDDVTYKEEQSFFGPSVIRKTTAELRNLVLGEIEPPYPPAARAVRARGKTLLLVTVDENGQVSRATAIDGHPLLRVASENVLKQTRFQKLVEKGKPVNYGGKIVINWDDLFDKLTENTNQ